MPKYVCKNHKISYSMYKYNSCVGCEECGEPITLMERKCTICDRLLTFHEFITTGSNNINNLPISFNERVKIWQNKYLALCCCTCTNICNILSKATRIIVELSNGMINCNILKMDGELPFDFPVPYNIQLSAIEYNNIKKWEIIDKKKQTITLSMKI